MAENDDIQICSAKDLNAYEGVELHRTLILMKDENFRTPILIDVFKINSEKENQYDLPIWFQGHLLGTNFEYQNENSRFKTTWNGTRLSALMEGSNGQYCC